MKIELGAWEKRRGWITVDLEERRKESIYVEAIK